jgi:hypothetical protein
LAARAMATVGFAAAGLGTQLAANAPAAATPNVFRNARRERV